MNKQTRLQLNHFFPETLGITSIEETDNQLTIQMKSLTSPKCHEVCHTHHSAYVRKARDLPILGKTVFLEITTYSYDCPNPACHVKTITEDYTHFLSAYSRMTERCMAFICTLALETSCENLSKNWDSDKWGHSHLSAHKKIRNTRTTCCCRYHWR